MHRVMSGGSMWNGDVSPSRVCEAIAKARTLGFTVLARVGIADRRWQAWLWRICYSVLLTMKIDM